ncbi:MAG: hypothetical protein MUO26_01555 [Methanotrichaceae archaeon]|nr:hypothetical protein [Methanotrichaceae archaeon]
MDINFHLSYFFRTGFGFKSKNTFMSYFISIVDAMSMLNELTITREDYLNYLNQRLRLQGSCQKEIENIGFPFLFASGSELLRSYILGETEFASTLEDKYKLPDRGFIWYLFSQAVREIFVAPENIVIKYELQEEYRKPFRQFYL